MKTIYAILSVCIALFQIGPCRSTELFEQIEAAAQFCTNQYPSGLGFPAEQLFETTIPETNENAQKLLECGAAYLKILNETGDFDFERLSLVLQEVVKKVRNREDFDKEAKIIADQAVEHCKNVSKSENAGLTAVRIWNCLINYKAF